MATPKKQDSPIKKSPGKKIKLKKFVNELDLKDKSKLKAAVLKYDVDQDKAPKIVGIGKGQVAEKILKVAEEHRIPFYEDPSLIDLLSKLEIQSEVPPQLYNLVAEVLSFVYKLDRLAKKKALVTNKFNSKRNQT
tara:strand:- start:14249 stop:14653 length:405 start_codon:yes stop_codon:yes gene_type:complete